MVVEVSFLDFEFKFDRGLFHFRFYCSELVEKIQKEIALEKLKKKNYCPIYTYLSDSVD